MTKHILITSRAEKEIESLPKADADRVHAAILAMKGGLIGDIKKLVNETPEYRLRVGKWRILFEIEKDTIVIHRVLDRKDAYRN